MFEPHGRWTDVGGMDGCLMDGRGREAEDACAGVTQVPEVETVHMSMHLGTTKAAAQSGAHPGGGGEGGGNTPAKISQEDRKIARGGTHQAYRCRGAGRWAVGGNSREGGTDTYMATIADKRRMRGAQEGPRKTAAVGRDYTKRMWTPPWVAEAGHEHASGRRKKAHRRAQVVTKGETELAAPERRKRHIQAQAPTTPWTST